MWGKPLSTGGGVGAITLTLDLRFMVLEERPLWTPHYVPSLLKSWEEG